jgi:hypothetical protein
MNGSRNEGKSESNEKQIKNGFSSFDIFNETPKYYKELLKSYEKSKNYKNNENTNSRDENEERTFNINEGVSFPNFSAISIICPKESQKENEDRSNEGLSLYDSFLFLLNELLNQPKSFCEKGKKSLIKQDNVNVNGKVKINIDDKKNIDKSNEEEDESMDFYYNDINELGKFIRKLIKFYMNLLKRNKEKILNGKEKNIIKISEQNNKNNQLDIEIDKFDICNKVLEDGEQKEEDSMGKYDLFLSAQKKELINGLKRKEEKEEKNRCNIQRISTKLKEKLKKNK